MAFQSTIKIKRDDATKDLKHCCHMLWILCREQAIILPSTVKVPIGFSLWCPQELFEVLHLAPGIISFHKLHSSFFSHWIQKSGKVLQRFEVPKHRNILSLSQFLFWCEMDVSWYMWWYRGGRGFTLYIYIFGDEKFKVSWKMQSQCTPNIYQVSHAWGFTFQKMYM